jgi:1-acyl-sn-glycerol-3-phosphate acyltransferase
VNPRVVLSLPLVLLATLAFGIPSIVGGLLDRSGRLSRRLAGGWGRFLLRLWGVSVEVQGWENAPAAAAVYAANHGSVLDIPILFAYLPVDFRILHKRSLYLIPVLGLYLYFGGHIGIDRGNPFRAKRSLLRASERIRSGTSVAVFPEGTRSPDASVQRFKRGSFMLALEAGVPLVPVSLAGIKTLVPRGLLRMRSGRVTMVIHSPVSTEGRTANEAARLAEEIRTRVADGCART